MLPQVPSAPERLTKVAAWRWIASEGSLRSHRAHRVKLLAASPAPQFNAHDAGSATIVTSLPHVLSAAHGFNSMVYDSGAPVKRANITSEHAEVELLAVCPARNSRCMRLNQQHRCRKCRQHSHRHTETNRAKEWLAQGRCQRSQRACRGGAAGWVLRGAINNA